MADYYVDPAATGAADGSSWTDAWTSLQTAVNAVSAGDTILCRGSQTLTTAITFGTDGTPAAPITMVGYNASGVEDGTFFALDGNSTATSCIDLTASTDYWEWRNISCTGATSFGIDISSLSQFHVWKNVKSFNNDGAGLNAATNLRASQFHGCVFTGNGTDGTIGPYACQLYNCLVQGNADDGISNINYCTVFGCLVTGNGEHGIYMGGFCSAINNTIDNNGVAGAGGPWNGIDVNGNGNSAYGNRITGHPGYGIGLFDTTATISEDWNFIAGNTTGVYETPAQVIAGSNTVTTGTEGYTDAATNNFTLTSSATMRREEIVLDANNSYFLTAGQSPDDAAAGGGGTARTTLQIVG